MRSYPNGIPPGALGRALEAAAALERSPTRIQPRSMLSSAADPASWFPLGPTPVMNGPTYGGPSVAASGRATIIAPNPASPSEVWLGTATGGLWHTVNAQTSDPEWVPIDGLQFPDSLPGPNGGNVTPGAMAMSVGSVTVDGCSATGSCTRVWIGTGEDGIRRETFYGSGLFLLTPFVEGPTVAQVVDFRFGSVVRVALPPHGAGTTTDTVYVAVSSGETAPGSEETVTAPAPAGGYGVYMTSDATSFTKLPIPGVGSSLPTDIEFDPSDSTGQTLLVGFTAANRFDPNAARGIFRGTNGGLNASDWCSVNDNSVAGVPRCAGSSGLPAGNRVITNPPVTGQDEVVGYITMRFSPSVPKRVYAMIAQCGQRTDVGCPPTTVFRSEDAGLTWSPVSTATSAIKAAFYGRYTHALAVVPGGSSAAEQIVLGGLVLLTCSGVGGGCAALGNAISQTHPDHHDVVFPDPANPSIVYNANDGGFFYSTDGGNNFTPANTTLTTSQLDSIAVYDQNILGGLQDQGMGYFTGTRVWTDIQIGDGGFSAVYAFGNPAEAVWYYSGGQLPPVRSVNDPTSNGTSLASSMPTSAPAEANGGAKQGLTAKCAFFPPIALNRVNHDVYFATIRVYKSTDTVDPHGASWTDVSPVLATQQGSTIDVLESDNVITALGVGDDGGLYVGTYTGEVWASASPCNTMSCWNRVAGPGTAAPLPNLPISSFAVQPGNSSAAFVTLSGFGTPNHVWETTSRGASWAATSNGLVDAPANVVRFDSIGTPRLGTDIGLYTFDTTTTTWTREQTLPFVPVVDIAAWSTGTGTQRLYAATHGRGAWVLAQPTVGTLEGWANNAIWDVPVFGYGFTNTTGNPVSCTISLVQQSGAVCASGGTDVSRNNFGPGGTIQVDTNGALQTTQPAPASTWDNKPVAWACNQGHCLNGTPIANCNKDAVGNQDFLSSVIVDCGVAGKGTARILGAPTLGNPPGTALLFDPPPDAPPAPLPPTWTFEALVSLTTSTGSSLVCRAPVTVNQGAPDDQIVTATATAINGSPECAGAGVIATAVVTDVSTGEDPGSLPPNVQVKITNTSGSQLFVTFRSAPGGATGLCFNMGGLGNPTLHQTAIMQSVVQTAATGAAGGTIRIAEGTDIGVCLRDVPTTAGMTADQVAAAVGQAFTSITKPGPVACLARNNPLDVEVGHLGENPGTLYTVISHQLQVCSFDPGVGFAVSPDGVTVPVSAEACVVGTSSLRLAQSVATSGGIATNSLDMEAGATANGGANINNVGGAQVRISGGTINGTVRIAGAAPSQANGELLNGGKIVGPVITGAGLQSILPTQVVNPGTTPITVNSNSPPRTIAPGNYGAVNVNGSSVTFVAGTYNLASLTVNAGASVRFDTSGGPIAIGVQGAVTINGGVFTAGNSAEVSLYTNSSASSAVVVNAGVTSFPATITAPNGGVTIGSRVVVGGCVGGQTVDFEPNSAATSRAPATGCADGTREGFANLNTFPNIAGCSGGWTVPGVMATNPGTAPACPTIATHDTVTPACSRMGGNDGLNPNGAGCDVADLCAAGWHVCATSADISSHSPTGCTGATLSTDPRLFFVSRQSSNGCGECATGTRTTSDCNSSSCTAACAQTSETSNDVFGCGNFGAASGLVGCGPIDDFSQNHCSGLSGSSWSCNDDGSGLCEAFTVIHSGPDFGGALCCKD
jgi:hypothetical protein